MSLVSYLLSIHIFVSLYIYNTQITLKKGVASFKADLWRSNLYLQWPSSLTTNSLGFCAADYISPQQRLKWASHCALTMLTTPSAARWPRLIFLEIVEKLQEEDVWIEAHFLSYLHMKNIHQLKSIN